MRLFFSLILSLVIFLSVALSVHARSNPQYICIHNGATASETNYNNGNYGNEYEDTSGMNGGFCSPTAICDDNYSDPSGAPCAEFSQIKCVCTGLTSFSCGIKTTNEFSRGCGYGLVCDMSGFKAGSSWPCKSSTNTTNAASAGTTYNPCPNGFCSTGIGVINVSSPQFFIQSLFSVLLSVSGVVALILIIFSGYQMSMSQGNPEKVKAARERLSAAIIGLVFIIFSVSILQVIGFDILHIPGFTK